MILSTPRRTGLSLLEVLVALAIFLFSLAALGELLHQGSDRAVDTERQACRRVHDHFRTLELALQCSLVPYIALCPGHARRIIRRVKFVNVQQMNLRPVGQFQRYRMPIPGLWLCGAGAHPGGNVSGAAGANAAREILKDRRQRRAAP